MSGLKQKLKLLYLKEILERYTDKEHNLTSAEILRKLHDRQIEVQQRTLHDDIDSFMEGMNDFDMELVNNVKAGKDKARPLRYWLDKRLFTVTEVKLLMESISGIHSLSEEATREIQKKLASLCSNYEATTIRSQLAVVGGFKAYWSTKRKRDILLNNMEVVDRAIAEDKKIKFRYFWYKSNKKPTYPRDKDLVHIASPLTRVLDNGYYYLIVLNEKDQLYHYRMDRITNPEIIDESRGIAEDHFVNTINWVDYVNSSMGMGFTNQASNPDPFSYKRLGSGYQKNYMTPSIVVDNCKYAVRMRLTRNMVGVVLDRFGKGAWIEPDDKGHFIASFDVYYNHQFVGWVLGMGNKVKILSPVFMADHISYYATAVGRWHDR